LDIDLVIVFELDQANPVFLSGCFDGLVQLSRGRVLRVKLLEIVRRSVATLDAATPTASSAATQRMSAAGRGEACQYADAHRVRLGEFGRDGVVVDFFKFARLAIDGHVR